MRQVYQYPKRTVLPLFFALVLPIVILTLLGVQLLFKPIVFWHLLVLHLVLGVFLLITQKEFHKVTLQEQFGFLRETERETERDLVFQYTRALHYAGTWTYGIATALLVTAFDYITFFYVTFVLFSVTAHILALLNGLNGYQKAYDEAAQYIREEVDTLAWSPFLPAGNVPKEQFTGAPKGTWILKLYYPRSVDIGRERDGVRQRYHDKRFALFVKRDPSVYPAEWLCAFTSETYEFTIGQHVNARDISEPIIHIHIPTSKKHIFGMQLLEKIADRETMRV
jgi:hypothetical protein